MEGASSFMLLTTALHLAACCCLLDQGVLGACWPGSGRIFTVTLLPTALQLTACLLSALSQSAGLPLEPESFIPNSLQLVGVCSATHLEFKLTKYFLCLALALEPEAASS